MPKPLPASVKQAAVQRVQAHMAGGASMRAACEAAGVRLSAFQRWSSQLLTRGHLMADYSNSGRKPKFELSEIEEKTLREMVLIYDSQTFAIEQWAGTHPECRSATREAILDELDRAAKERRFPRWPRSLMRAASVSQEERALLRGGKAFDALSFSPRKGLFITLEDGTQVTLHPHTVWTMDDYSTNQPYQVQADDGSTRVCRQVLAAMDCASDAWLSVEMIGRERDAYRGEDILRFILRTIDGQGTMPEYLLLERGRWDSSAVHGLDLGCIERKYDGRTWGGLDALFCIIHGYSSRHKAQLESSFSILQRALAHSGTDIGRVRGEFQEATRRYLAVQNGRMDATAAGFLTIDEARELHWQAMQLLNARGKHRAAMGTVEVPNDLLSMFCDSDRRPLPASERWRFLPVKRKATARSGFVEMMVAPYRQPFRFQVAGLAEAPYINTGHTLLVAFDPAMPALGAYVANGETGSANREGWGLGQYLFVAPHAADVAMIDLRSGGYKDSSKRRASTQARTAFAAINPLRRRGLAVTSHHDGAGNATISRTGITAITDGLTGHVEAAEPTAAVATTRHRMPADEATENLSPASHRRNTPSIPRISAEQSQRLTEEALAALDGL